MSSPDQRRRLLTLLSALTTSTPILGGGGSDGGVHGIDAAAGSRTGPKPPGANRNFEVEVTQGLSLSGEVRAALEVVVEAPSLELPELPILVQSIVEPVGTTSEGSLVTTVRPVWVALIRLLSQDPDALHKLTPRQLEELVAASYEQAGFDEVTLTPRSGDRGRDVIAVKRGFCTVRIIDQVKHYDPDRVVSANDVRALVGVLLSDERATKGFVTTSARFAPGIETDPFIAKHVPYRLELIDGRNLLSRLKSHS